MEVLGTRTAAALLRYSNAPLPRCLSLRPLREAGWIFVGAWLASQLDCQECQDPKNTWLSQVRCAHQAGAGSWPNICANIMRASR